MARRRGYESSTYLNDGFCGMYDCYAWLKYAVIAYAGWLLGYTIALSDFWGQL